MDIFSSGSYSSGVSQSQKKRLLAKAQSECMLNGTSGVVTKQEPGGEVYQQVCHAGAACKEPYHYVTTQDQHIVYSR